MCPNNAVLSLYSSNVVIWADKMMKICFPNKKWNICMMTQKTKVEKSGWISTVAGNFKLLHASHAQHIAFDTFHLEILNSSCVCTAACGCTLYCLYSYTPPPSLFTLLTPAQIYSCLWLYSFLPLPSASCLLLSGFLLTILSRHLSRSVYIPYLHDVWLQGSVLRISEEFNHSLDWKFECC